MERELLKHWMRFRELSTKQLHNTTLDGCSTFLCSAAKVHLRGDSTQKFEFLYKSVSIKPTATLNGLNQLAVGHWNISARKCSACVTLEDFRLNYWAANFTDFPFRKSFSFGQTQKSNESEWVRWNKRRYDQHNGSDCKCCSYGFSSFRHIKQKLFNRILREI